MGRRGNPYDNAKAESFMKTIKVEDAGAAARRIPRHPDDGPSARELRRPQ